MKYNGQNVHKKIKIAMIATHFDVTGIGSVIMNYCLALDHNKYDLTVIAGVPISDQYKKQCSKNGIHIIALPSRHNDSFNHYKQLYKALKKNHYDIFHDHGNSSMMAIELTLAKTAGIRIRIAHCHNTRCPNKTVHKLLNPYFNRVYTKAIACGEMAGDWLYGKGNFEVLPNGFKTEKFMFSENNRKRLRAKLNLGKKLVIGHMGRLNDQKNQSYLIDVFEGVAKKRSDAVLLLVGNGPDEEKIKKRVNDSPYKGRIILYGVTDDPAALYSAMDLFVLPSKYEGLPVVLLEAQISGLPCLVSDKVTREVDFGDLIWASIDDSPNAWCQKIESLNIRSDIDRENYYDKHLNQIEQYNIKNTVQQLDRIYSSLIYETER